MLFFVVLLGFFNLKDDFFSPSWNHFYFTLINATARHQIGSYVLLQTLCMHYKLEENLSYLGSRLSLLSLPHCRFCCILLEENTPCWVWQWGRGRYCSSMSPCHPRQRLLPVNTQKEYPFGFLHLPLFLSASLWVYSKALSFMKEHICCIPKLYLRNFNTESIQCKGISLWPGSKLILWAMNLVLFLLSQWLGIQSKIQQNAWKSLLDFLIIFALYLHIHEAEVDFSVWV